MGVDLTSGSGQSAGFSSSYSGWSMILDLASEYGWVPLGTEPPDGMETPSEWSGQYCSSDGQRVSAADAGAMADALQSAVADPNLPAKLAQMDVEQREGISERSGPELATSYAGVRDYDEYIECMQEFIDFCREGSFRID